MAKYFYFFFISISISSNLFSQETNISTEFSQDGILYESLNEVPKALTPFKIDDTCIVVDYLGKDKYKIKYKNWVGVVDSQYLVINEDMMDLFYAYQEKMRIEAVKSEQKRKREVQEIIKKNNEKRKEDSLGKIREEAHVVISKDEDKRKERGQQDSIAKTIEEEKIKKAAQELARKNKEEISKKRREDSIVKIIGEEESKKAIQELARQNQEYINTKRKEDSIVKVKEAEKKRQELQELAIKMQKEIKKQEKINVSRHEDSIARIIEEEKSQKAEQELARENEEEIQERNEFRNSCHYLMNEYDETYNVRTVKTDPYRVSENLTIELYEYGQNKQVFFNLSQDLGCASYLLNNRSYVKVTLENDQVVTFYHFWDIDCGNFSLKGKLSNSQMIILEKLPIKSIRFQGTKYPYEITNIDYKEFFMDKLKCLD